MNRLSYTLLLIASPLLGLACVPIKANPDGGSADAMTTPDVDAGPPDAALPDADPSLPDASIPDATEAPPTNLVFVTSTTYTGNFGGRDGGDTICNELAHGAGHDGNFRAYLSTTTEDAIERIQSARGWVRADGEPVADTAETLATKGPFATVRLDELGRPVSPPAVWTGSRQGIYYPSYGSCLDWTKEVVPSTDPAEPYHAATGNAALGGSNFQFASNGLCTSKAALLCFQIDHQNPVTPPPAPNHKLAFITVGKLAIGTGLAGADALCRQEATDHQRAGNFRAVLATNGASAASRFLPSDGPWKRVDGMPLTKDGAGLFDESQELLAPLNVDLEGIHLGSDEVWIGASSLTATPSTADSTCNDWTSTTAAGTKGVRASQVARTSINTPCSNGPRKILCLETAQ